MRPTTTTSFTNEPVEPMFETTVVKVTVEKKTEVIDVRSLDKRRIMFLLTEKTPDPRVVSMRCGGQFEGIFRGFERESGSGNSFNLFFYGDIRSPYCLTPQQEPIIPENININTMDIDLVVNLMMSTTKTRFFRLGNFCFDGFLTKLEREDGSGDSFILSFYECISGASPKYTKIYWNRRSMKTNKVLSHG